jgi:hypothetical protein
MRGRESRLVTVTVTVLIGLTSSGYFDARQRRIYHNGLRTFEVRPTPATRIGAAGAEDVGLRVRSAKMNLILIFPSVDNPG